MSLTIIGITGFPGAGKDSFAKLLQKQFSEHNCTAIIISSGDIIRRYVREHRLGDPSDRTVLQDEASKVMAKDGYDVWLRQAVATAEPGTDILLYPGMRHPDEVAYIHAQGGITVGIDVPIDLRYERSQKRDRPGDEMSFAEFKADDEAERNGRGQQVGAVMRSVRLAVRNNGSWEQLEAVAARIVADFPDDLKPSYNAKEA